MSSEIDIPVVGSRILPPDPAVMKGIGLNHTLPSAIADLVDNSIDATATHVLIRFVRSGTKLTSLMVIDDGHGIPADEIDNAMTVGGRRNYEDGDLGRFGLGLKAASLGQADSVTVLSGQDNDYAGRRWTVQGAEQGFQCDVVDATFAKEHLRRSWGSMDSGVGTIVRWDNVRGFPTSNKALDTDRYLDRTANEVCTWLGLIFHRFISDDRLALEVDVEDVRTSQRLSVTPVVAIDPFGYFRSPKAPYPIRLPVNVSGQLLDLECHIWPARSPLPGFRFRGTTAEQSQGFYAYRNDRLLQVGGWNTFVQPRRSLQLARVCIELDGDLDRHFRMNPEKTLIASFPEGFHEELESAVSLEGLGFHDYLGDAEDTYKRWNKPSRARRKVVPPGRGIDGNVRKAIRKQLDFIEGEDPFDIRWANFYTDDFFDIDLDERVLYLNRRYRASISGNRESSINDVPMVKALLYLLVEPLFRGPYLGPREKDNVEIWQMILTAAAEAEAE